MMSNTKDTRLFQSGHVWKEKNSNAHIMIGDNKYGKELIPCFLVNVKKTHLETSYERSEFWCNAHPSALFNHFIKII